MKYNDVALVIVAFNRPELLRQQLKILRSCYRGKVFAVIDGPRIDNPYESDHVKEVVMLIEGLRNEYDLYINCSPVNLGCYKRIKTGLDWVFLHVDKAIILEDDCMPSPAFFSFATSMLEKYANENRVFSISGTNLYADISSPGDTFFFSRYPHCWGWATWRRAWDCFIDSQDEWGIIENTNDFKGLFRNYRSYLYWKIIFRQTYSGKINSWFYRWMLTCWMHNSVSIYPPFNMITNVGDGDDATHTQGYRFLNRSLGNGPSTFTAPKHIVVNHAFDTRLENNIYSKSLYARFLWVFSRGIKVALKWK